MVSSVSSSLTNRDSDGNSTTNTTTATPSDSGDADTDTDANADTDVNADTDGETDRNTDANGDTPENDEPPAPAGRLCKYCTGIYREIPTGSGRVICPHCRTSPDGQLEPPVPDDHEDDSNGGNNASDNTSTSTSTSTSTIDVWPPRHGSVPNALIDLHESVAERRRSVAAWSQVRRIIHQNREQYPNSDAVVLVGGFEDGLDTEDRHVDGDMSASTWPNTGTN